MCYLLTNMRLRRQQVAFHVLPNSSGDFVNKPCGSPKAARIDTATGYLSATLALRKGNHIRAMHVFFPSCKHLVFTELLLLYGRLHQLRCSVIAILLHWISFDTIQICLIRFVCIGQYWAMLRFILVVRLLVYFTGNSK